MSAEEQAAGAPLDDAYADEGFEDEAQDDAGPNPPGGTQPEPAPAAQPPAEPAAQPAPQPAAQPVAQPAAQPIDPPGPTAPGLVSTSSVVSQPQSAGYSLDGPPQQSWQMRQVQPNNQKEWQQVTKQKLSMARALIRDAKMQTSKNESGNRSARKFMPKKGEVDFHLKSKLMKSADSIKSIEERISAIEDAIRNLGSCLYELQRAYRAKYAMLNVCEKRMQLRDGRPLQELVRDNLQAALENERQVLLEARQELSDQISNTKKGLQILEAMKHELIEELGNKRQALRVDRSCLQPEKLSTNRIFLPALPEITHYTLPPAPGQVTDQSASFTSEAKDTPTLLHRSVKLEENAHGLIAENDAVIRHCNAECRNANDATCKCMDKSNHQTEQLKDALVEHMKEIDAMIAEGERSLAKTKKSLDSQNAPLRSLNKQFAVRDSSEDKEGSPAMLKQLDSVKKNVRDLTAKWESTKNILDHLKASKLQMAEDLRHKNIALEIDDKCRKVTPKKAIEHDELDPCSGRVHPTGKKNVNGRLQAVVDREFA